MRKVALAAALLISSAAIAQTTVDDQTDMTTDPVDITTTEPTTSSATDRWANDTADPASTTTHTTISTTHSTGLASTHDNMTQTAMASSQQVAPSNENPERDARGIAVISDPAFVPAGYNGIPATAVGGPDLEAENYPPCTASVTDNCRQTYERGID